MPAGGKAYPTPNIPPIRRKTCNFVQMSAGAKLGRACMAPPIACKRRPLLKLGAHADEFHAREEHGPDHVGDAIGRRHEHGTAIAKRLLEPIHEAERFGATLSRRAARRPRDRRRGRARQRPRHAPHRPWRGRDFGRHVRGGGDGPTSSRLGIMIRARGLRGEKPAEGQFLDRIAVVKVEPGFRLAIERCRADAQRILGDVPALVEDAVRQHQRRHGHVRIEPHIIRPLLDHPEMDVDARPARRRCRLR